MKKIFSAISLSVAVLAFASCSGNNKQAVSAGSEQTVSVSEEAAIPVALEESVLNWKGFKPGGEHFGTIALEAGEIKLAGDKLVAGHVVVKMNSILVKDLEGEMADKLKGHLESADFFEAEAYPTAKFELTNLNEGVELATITELTGNLTLKDVTKNITIPVEEVTADAATGSYLIKSKPFVINRADWNVKYGSKTFFDNLADNFIEDNIELQFVLVAKK